MTQSEHLIESARAFRVWGDFLKVEPFGSGHINDSYAATFHQAGRPVRYLLQRINESVFTDVDGLMSNLARVCSHAHGMINSYFDRRRASNGS